MKNLVSGAFGLIIAIGLLLVMTGFIDQPESIVESVRDEPVFPITEEPEIEEPKPNQVPQPPALSIEPTLGESIDISVTEPLIATIESTSLLGKNVEVLELPELTSINSIPNNLNDRQAMALIQTTPRYPIVALTKGIEGWVKLSYDVNPMGIATNINILDASPKRIFDREARRALRQWKFKAPIENGVAVSLSNQAVTMEFKFDSDLAQE